MRIPGPVGGMIHGPVIAKSSDNPTRSHRMNDRLLIGTKKGLFELRRSRGEWSITATRFLGDPISMLLADPRDGTLFAAEALGHFGVKLQRSRDHGASWQEIPAPAFPKTDVEGPSVSYLF